MGGGGKGGGGSVSQRPLTATELKNIEASTRSTDAMVEIAKKQDARSESSYNDWSSVYKDKEAVLGNDLFGANSLSDKYNALADAHGTADEKVLSRERNRALSDNSLSYKGADDRLSKMLAKRGISNSGIAGSAFTNLATNRANSTNLAYDNAYNNAVQKSDARRGMQMASLQQGHNDKMAFVGQGRGLAGISQNYLGQAGQTYGQAGNNYNNVASSQGQLNNQWNATQENANAQRSSGKGAMTGALAGGAMQAGAIAYASDERLKENIEYVGEFYGYSFYTWDWNEKGLEIADPNQPTFGVMAQEAKTVNPKAVHMADDGYYRVDYNLIMGGAL